jgi:hypothetical protein
MTRYNAEQIGGFAKGAGFSGKGLTIAIAVALAESGGNPNATGPVGEKGLWQVYPRAHPDWDRGGNLYDPAYNARAAYSISGQGINWHPWTTYNIGSYLLFMPTAEVAAQKAQPVTGLGAAPAQALTHVPDVAGNIRSALDTAGQLGRIGDDLQVAGKYLASPTTWIRVGEFILGGVLIIAGVSIMARPLTQPAAQAAITAAKVIPK